MKQLCMTEQRLKEMRLTAENYHLKGLTIIPFFIDPAAVLGIHGKDPNILTYKVWNERPQTQEEYQALNWEGCNGFGLILGQKANDGRYLVAIDFDPKIRADATEEEFKAHKEAVKIGEVILASFPTTMAEQTVNHGTHKLYWSRTHAEINNTFHLQTAIELLGEKKLCVMAPSYGYSNVGSDLITEVEDIKALYFELLKEHGFVRTEKTEIENQVNRFSFPIAQMIDLTVLKEETLGSGTYRGKHPFHESATGNNFAVDTKHNVWCCHRHNSGGGSLQYLAMKEGLISCEDSKNGALRGAKFKKVLQIAEANGYIDKEVLDQAEINPVILAKDIMIDYTFVVDKDSNEPYYWIEKEGVYTNQTEQLIKREIASRLNDNFKARYYTEVKEFVTATAPLIAMNSQKPELLAVKNGLLNVFTKEITAFNPEVYITAKLDWDFKDGVKAPYFENFLNTVLPDQVQQRQVQQLIGHCLYRKIITETCLILLGTGANGKSIFLDTIKTFLGTKNISSHVIQQLCYDKFSVENLKNKLANICADLPHKELVNTGTYKALVSGDPIEVYIKHVQKSQTIEPYTKFLYSANHIPPITGEEDSNAWYRRFVFADFKVTFTDKNKIPRQELLEKLSTPEEMTGILNWALAGLKELNANGEISDKPSSDIIRKEYRKHSSTTLAYFDAQVTITDNEKDFVFTDIWFREYVTFCHSQDLTPKSKFQFIQDAETFLPGAFHTKIRPEALMIAGKLKAQSPVSAWRYIITNQPKEQPPKDKEQTTLTGKPKNIETVKVEHFKPTVGKLCSQPEADEEPCPIEAEYSINKNLYCPRHFEEEKEQLRKQGKICCAEWTTGEN
jgi:P4 family phage/plasmid primase-like protien